MILRMNFAIGAFIVVVVMLSASIVFGAPKFSTDPVKKGLEIAVEIDKRDSGFGTQRNDMKMVLKDRHGRESTRVIRNSILEVKGDGDKSLISFDTPRTVKGTRFLSYTHKSGPDDQWLFLPKLKRVKRIASDNKSGPFMGSEFAYEDIASQEVEKYKYKYLKDEACGSLKCFVVERYPVDKKSGYSKQVVWVDQGEFRVQKIEYYDVKKSLLKTLVFKGYKQFLNKFWRPAIMDMKNHQTGKATVLEMSNFKFKTKLTARDFDLNALKRGK